MNVIRIALFAALPLLLIAPGSARSQDDLTEAELTALVSKARSALIEKDYEAAFAAAKKLTQSADAKGFHMFAGDIMLRSGKAKQAIEQFEKHLEQRPKDRPYLWQLGIALYFDKQFKAGAELFEIHRKVNPNDVENAAWHFLCIAKHQSAAKAKQMLLPAPDDPRPPMQEVLEMLDTGDTETVKKKMESFTPNTSQRDSAMFYGNLYLGLYADALGDLDMAKKYMDAAAKDSPRNYMGDVAVVYAAFLKEAAKNGTKR